MPKIIVETGFCNQEIVDDFKKAFKICIDSLKRTIRSNKKDFEDCEIVHVFQDKPFSEAIPYDYEILKKEFAKTKRVTLQISDKERLLLGDVAFIMGKAYYDKRAKQGQEELEKIFKCLY